MIIRKLICPDSPRGFLEGSGPGSGGDGDKQSKGTTFGVDGVSKTGSTAQDAAIGFTAGEGTGRPGANFEALSGATREQTDKAVAAAQAAQRAGESPQRAAAEAIGAPAPINPIARAIGLDSPYARPTTAADEAAFDDFLANEVLANEVTGAPIPESRLNVTYSAPRVQGLGSFMTAAGETRPPISDGMSGRLAEMSNFALARRVNAPAYSGVTSDMAISELSRRARAGDPEASRDLSKAGVVMAPPPRPALPSMVQPEISADTVLSGGISGLLPDELSTPPMTSVPQQLPDELSGQPMSGSARTDYYGEDTLQANLFGVPGGPDLTSAFPSATVAGQFAENIQRIPQAIQGIPGVMSLMGPRFAQGARDQMERFIGAGAKYNEETERLELDTGRGRLQMNNLGSLTYSGMPDPSYTGPFANLVNPPEQERGGGETMTEAVVEEAVSDPCPAGYTLVDGVCQPAADVTAPDTRFTLPATPMSFQPTTVATPVQQINPFVLSPTGAALGRQI